MLSKVASSTIFWVFGMIRPGIEPRSPRPLANTLTIMPMSCYVDDIFILWPHQKDVKGVSSWRNGLSDGLRNRSTWVRTPVALLRSLSGKYPWERYEPPYPPSYGLNSTTTVLLGEWIWHWITYKGWYAIKQRNQTKPNQKGVQTLLDHVNSIRYSSLL